MAELKTAKFLPNKSAKLRSSENNMFYGIRTQHRA